MTAKHDTDNAHTDDEPEPERTDLRALDGHESWRGVYGLLECSTAADAGADPMVAADRIAAATRSDRSEAYRRKHARGVSS